MKNIKNYSPSVMQAFQRACDVRMRAYAPYSKFLVGASAKLKDSDTFVDGCNVENMSYGGTVCAERLAVCSSVSLHGHVNWEFLVLVTVSHPLATPCGFCLQTLAEFLPSSFPIYLATPEGIQEQVTLGDLLPRSFDGAFLKK
jgi:cytidine deaminase